MFRARGPLQSRDAELLGKAEALFDDMARRG
jgi:hypothetical protein